MSGVRATLKHTVLEVQICELLMLETYVETQERPEWRNRIDVADPNIEFFFFFWVKEPNIVGTKSHADLQIPDGLILR